MSLKLILNIFCVLSIAFFVRTNASNDFSEDSNVKGRIFENRLNKSAECIRNLLIEGLPEEGLPSFEPLVIRSFNLDFDDFPVPTPITSGYISIENFILKGMTKWQLKHLKFHPIIIGGIGYSIQASLTMPRLQIDTLYDTDLIYDEMKFFGKGDISSNITNLSLDLDIKYTLREPVKKFRALPGMDDFNIKFTGLFNDEEQSKLLGDLCNDIAVRWLNGKSKDIADLLEEIAKQIFNNRYFIKAKLSLSSIINIINDRCRPFGNI